tara:strand:+ start:1375 stop:2163 length:789 start_codon:yes stop_codon:yes gene_type:complete
MTIKINGTNTAANPSITGTDTDTGIVYGSDQIDFSTGGSSKVTLNGSNLGIGETSPTHKLEVVDSSFSPIYTRGSGNVGGIRFGNTSHTNGYIYYDNGPNMNFQVGGAERVRILSGGGIAFNGDTAAANALDDYEEGTFTCSLAAGGNTVSASYSYQTGVYTKIGRIVHVQTSINAYNLPNTGSDHVAIDGLPFTEGQGGGYKEASWSLGKTSSGTLGHMHGYVEGNSNKIRLQNAGNTNISVAALGTSVWFFGSATYTTNA